MSKLAISENQAPEATRLATERLAAFDAANKEPFQVVGGAIISCYDPNMAGEHPSRPDTMAAIYGRPLDATHIEFITGECPHDRENPSLRSVVFEKGHRVVFEVCFEMPNTLALELRPDQHLTPVIKISMCAKWLGTVKDTKKGEWISCDHESVAMTVIGYPFGFRTRPSAPCLSESWNCSVKLWKNNWIDQVRIVVPIGFVATAVRARENTSNRMACKNLRLLLGPEGSPTGVQTFATA